MALRLKRYPAPDVIVTPQGSVWLMTPISTAAEDWVRENVSVPEYAWFGDSFAIEYSYVPPILEGMKREGFIVRGAQ